MKKYARSSWGRAVAGLGLLLIATTAHAIEGLKIAVVQTNAVLSWPSAAGESYIVQWRGAFDTNCPWTSLSTNLSAAAGTNWTSFVHIGGVTYPLLGTGGGGGSQIPPPLFSSSSSSGAAATGDTAAASARKPKKKPVLPKLPPFPWDPAAQSPRPAPGAFALLSGGVQPMSNGPTGSTNTTCGFYRVVRNGVHFFDLANGQSLSGEGLLQIEAGVANPSVTITGFAISQDGTNNAIGGLALVPMDGWLDADWNTVAATNGTYHLSPLVELSNGESITGAVTTVTVANDIRFTDDFFVAGSLLHIEAQTIHTNGTWHLDVYGDDQWIGQVSGSVNAQGYCVYPGIAGNGFSLPLTYSDGTAFPYSSYATVMTTTPQVVQTGGPSKTATNTVFVEKPWWGPTQWAIAYMPIYPQFTPSDGYLQEMVAVPVVTAQTTYGGQSVVNAVFDQSPQAFQIRRLNQGDWNTLRLALLTQVNGNPTVRNFFFFGHGSGENIGGTNDPNLSLSRKDFQNMFNNAKDPLAGGNKHAFRFVFLDGCETASGDLCLDFGIPKKDLAGEEFLSKRGIRPRAFVGWKDKKLIGVAGELNQTHKMFIERFFNLWPLGDPNDGFYYGLKNALRDAALNSSGVPYTQMGTDISVYGSRDLLFYDDPITGP